MNKQELLEDIYYFIIVHIKIDKKMFEYSVYNKDIPEDILDEVVDELIRLGYKVGRLIDFRYSSEKVVGIFIKWD